MTLLLSSTWLGLAWFAAVNALASVIAWSLATRLASGDLGRRSPAYLLGLRLGPPAMAIVFTTVVFLPVHWRFEPIGPDESFGLVLRGLAVVGAVLLGRAGWRAFQVLRQSASLCALLGPARLEGGELAHVSDHLQGISLAGVFRTRIIVGTTARGALTPAELDVAIAHERAHAGARDNLKRFMMVCAPDFVGCTTVGRRIEEAWRAAAECQADARAAAGSEMRAVDLASALVKVARLTEHPPASVRPLVWSTFHEPPLLEARVRHLLAVAHVPAGTPSRRQPVAFWLLGALPALGLVWGQHLHRLTESLVRLLP